MCQCHYLYAADYSLLDCCGSVVPLILGLSAFSICQVTPKNTSLFHLKEQAKQKDKKQKKRHKLIQ